MKSLFLLAGLLLVVVAATDCRAGDFAPSAPCGKVVSAVKQGDKAQVASCENGNRYRIFLNAEGRVVAEKQ